MSYLVEYFGFGLITSGTAIIAFVAGFFSRWLLFKVKYRTDIVNSLISDIETNLIKIFEEAVAFIENMHSERPPSESIITIKQQLMVARVSHLKKIRNNIKKINKKCTVAQDDWIEFRQATDRIFDKPTDLTNLARLTQSISKLSTAFIRSR